MNANDLIALLPTGICVIGALLCFLLEAAGTPVGARKRGARTHLAVIALLAVGAAAVQVGVSWRDLISRRETGEAQTRILDVLVLDELALFGALAALFVVAMAILSAAPALRGTQSERGDVYGLILLHASGQLLMAGAANIVTVAGAWVFIAICQSALVVVGQRDAARAEAAAKLVMSAGLQLALLALGGAVAYGVTGTTSLEALAQVAGQGNPPALVGLALVVVVTFAMLPVVPLHYARLDVIHGAPPFAGALWLSGGLVAGSILAVRVLGALPGGGAALPSELRWVWLGVAAASVVAPAMAALDQQRVSRMGSYLAVAQGGVVCVALATTTSGGSGGVIALLFVVASSAFASLGALLGLAALDETQAATWEDWSGVGRVNPAFGLTLIWVLASLAGVPGTVGFAARLWAAEAAFDAGLDALGAVVMIAPVLAIAPVLRFALFLFAKPRRGRGPIQLGAARMAVLLVTAVLVLLGGLFSSSVFSALETLAPAAAPVQPPLRAPL